MKVLRLIESFFPVISGPAIQALRISEGLGRLGHRSPVLTSALGWNGRAPGLPVTVERFPIRRRYFKFLITPDLRHRLSEERYDCIHAHGYRSYQTEAGYVAAKRAGKPFVISTHGTLLAFRHFRMGLMRELPYHIYDSLFVKRTIRHADAIVANSAQEKQEAVGFGARRERVHHIPAGAHRFKRQKKSITQGRGLKLLWYGRLSRNRNVHSIIEALGVIRDAKTTLTVAGFEAKSSDAAKGGYGDELKGLVRDLGLEKRVRFTGSVPSERLPSLFDSHDVFVYPSLYENFGQTVLEAAASRMPLICTPSGVASEIIRDHENGLFITPDAESIADAFTEIADPAMRKAFSDGIAEAVQEGYSWKEIISRYLALYERIGH